MKSSARIFISGLTVGVLLWCPAGGLSQKPDGATTAAIILGTVAGDRGSMVGIPVYFKSGKDQVRSISLVVDFISNSVKFDKADANGGVSEQSMTLKVQSEDLPPGINNLPRTRLKITASMPDNVTNGSLPDGLWTFLNFKLSPDARAVAVSLQPSALVALGPANMPLAIVIEPGKVIVSADDEPMAGCFFFTH